MTELEQLKNDLVKIQERINKLENPAFEVGKWYKGINGHLWVIERLYEYGQKSYGFCSSGAWDDSVHRYSNFREFRLATDKEVEEALIKEAIKRGFKEGVEYRPVNYHEIVKVGNGSFVYDESENKLLYYGWACFKDGIWAEIIKDEPIKIGGYEVKKESGGFKVGCKTISSHFLGCLRVEMIDNKFNTVSFDGNEVTLETINKILTL